MHPRSMALCAATLLGATWACAKDVRHTTPTNDSATATDTVQGANLPRQQLPTGASYVGLTYNAPPAGVKSIGGATLSGPGTVRGNYAFNHVTTPRGEMIWLDTIGAPNRVVLAELPLPPLANDERLFIGSCDAAGRLDPRIIAIVVNQPGVTRFTEIRQAWRADPHLARFDLLPVAGIVCEDPDS
ncbi:MAG: hypothetical protein ABI205_02270 [Gemmatimonadaceae bacterium]